MRKPAAGLARGPLLSWDAQGSLRAQGRHVAGALVGSLALGHSGNGGERQGREGTCVRSEGWEVEMPL